ncbi:MAG: hypothetical protein JW822_05355 [Spirochaetales bacterium]|nr:hypothetical protein [Spirochaetales bacterium]
MITSYPEFEKSSDVFDFCCKTIANAYEKYSFSCAKSRHRISARSLDNNFKFEISFSSSIERNVSNENIVFKVHAGIESRHFCKWLEENISKKPTTVFFAADRIASRSLDPAYEPQDKTGYEWNMAIKYYRDDRLRVIIHLIDTIVLPIFNRFNNIAKLVEDITLGTSPVLNLDHRLSYVWINNPHRVIAFLCFIQSKEYAENAIKNYLNKYPEIKNELNNSIKNASKFEKNHAPCVSNNNRIQFLGHAAWYYELSI